MRYVASAIAALGEWRRKKTDLFAKQKISFGWVVWLPVILTLIAGIIIGFWIFSDILVQPLKMNKSYPFFYRFTPNGTPMQTEIAHAGEQLYVRRNFCIQGHVSGFVHRILMEVSGAKTLRLYRLPIESLPARRGCVDLFLAVALPAEIIPGKYEYLSRVEYQVNPMRTFTRNLDPVTLTIVAPGR